VTAFVEPSFPDNGDNGSAHAPYWVAPLNGSTNYAWTPLPASSGEPCVNNICNGPFDWAYDVQRHILYTANGDAGAFKIQLGGGSTPQGTTPTSTSTAVPTSSPTALTTPTATSTVATSTPLPTATGTATPSPMPSSTMTPTATSTVLPAAPSFTLSQGATPAVVQVNGLTKLWATATSNVNLRAVLDIEVYDAGSNKVEQIEVTEQFTAGQSTTLSVPWVPRSAGTYHVMAGVFKTDLSSSYIFNNPGTTIQVTH
jgi:hypothetical protein